MQGTQSALDVATDAAASIVDVGVVGALLVLSILANVALVVALIRCYRSHTHQQQTTGF